MKFDHRSQKKGGREDAAGKIMIKQIMPRLPENKSKNKLAIAAHRGAETNGVVDGLRREKRGGDLR